MSVTSTYRLQLHSGFGFADARKVVPYLARLGVSHLYLSPILQAVAGSMHGYDVVDHTRISGELGGREEFELLAQTAAEHDLGVIVDVVPNHMAFVAPESANLPLWQVLRDGRDATTAHWFDIDWKAGGGRIGLPVLGEELQTVLEAGELVIDEIPDPVATHAAGRDLGHRHSRVQAAGLSGALERVTDHARQRAERAAGLETGSETGSESAAGGGSEAGAPAMVPVIRYYEHVYPIALGTEGDVRPGENDATKVRSVLDRQHYRLASWREKDDVLNYRRFFEVDGLIAVRVELDDVFQATHALLLELNADGLIDGFRIDHPDGLADPGGYLEMLHSTTRKGTLVWVEKILEGDEELPTDWRSAGTTGYDAMRVVQAALVDTAAEPAVTAAWVAAGGEPNLLSAVEEAKRQVVRQSLVPEVERLTRRAREANPGLEPERLRSAVVELLVAGEVYRAYVRADEGLSAKARERLTEAFTRALHERPDLGEELQALVPLTVAHHDDPSTLDFSVRLQQTWGPVMAKGIEDTTFYRWHRLIALNEVGGDPADLDRPQTGEGSGSALLHGWAARQQADWPQGMTTLSTHDTKRSEDVRARILAVAGDPVSWQRCSDAAREAAAAADVDGPTAHLVWQTILGVGAIPSERLDEYLVKALREGKQRTAWVDGDPDYEQRVLDLAHTMRDGGPVRAALEDALAANTEAVRATVLAAKALALTLPGVPDTYQGCEIVDLSLVDPDNRRPVDYEKRTRLLGSFPQADDEASAGPVGDLDAEKLWLTSRVLRLRRELPDVFAGAYEPLETSPEAADHVLGFVRTASSGLLAGVFGREQAVATLVTLAPSRLAAQGGWGGQTVSLPEGRWRDVLGGGVVEGTVECAQVFARYPVAVLQRE